MAVKKLTDVTLRALKAPKTGRLELWDSLLPGFGVRVTDKDARSYFVMYRSGAGADRRQKRLKIGDAKILDLATARERAREALRQAQAGVDPAVKVKAADASPPGFRATVVDYCERYIDKQTRGATTAEWRRIFAVDVIPEWQDRPVESIKRNDIEKLLDKITKRCPQGTHANRVLARLKHFFQWCVDRDLIDTSPAARFKPVVKEEARDRALSEQELRWFVKACDDIGDPFGALFLFLLLTAQRRDEAATMEWQEVDFAARLWTIPKEKAKNGVAHEVALSEQARAILNRMADNKISTRFVFSTNGVAAVSGFSKGKARLNAAFEKRRRAELGLPGEVDAVERFTLHDLRRTAATGMAGLGVLPHVVEKLLNHSGGSIRGVAAVYNRFKYSDERRDALDQWGRHVAAIAAA